MCDEKRRQKNKSAFGAAAKVVDGEETLAFAIEKLNEKVQAYIANDGIVGDKLSRAAAGLRYTVEAAILSASSPKKGNDVLSDSEWREKNPDHLFGPNSM